MPPFKCQRLVYLQRFRHEIINIFVLEKARGATPLIRMDGNQTFISKPSSKEDNFKAFTFDKSYWSANKDDDHYADQELVYNDLGRELLDHAFDGYNCCIFACK